MMVLVARKRRLKIVSGEKHHTAVFACERMQRCILLILGGDLNPSANTLPYPPLCCGRAHEVRRVGDSHTLKFF